MHSCRAAAAYNASARAAFNLQCLNDYYLRTICRLLPYTSNSRKLLLTECPSCFCKCFGGAIICNVWYSLAGLPVGSLYDTICLNNPTDAFQGGACNMVSLLAACLHSVGLEMPRVHDVVPL